MESLGAPLRADRIRVENREGLDQPIHLLARYAALPLLGDTFGKWVFLVRPSTRALVLADPETDYADEKMRDRQRDLIAESIVKELPSDLHTDVLAEDTELVTVRSRLSGPFEFSHFSDEELADGLLAMAIGEYLGDRHGLIRRIGEERVKPHAMKKRRGPDVGTVWEEWIPDYEFSKQKFAHRMWPVLEAQVRDAVSRGTANPPIANHGGGDRGAAPLAPATGASRGRAGDQHAQRRLGRHAQSERRKLPARANLPPYGGGERLLRLPRQDEPGARPRSLPATIGLVVDPVEHGGGPLNRLPKSRGCRHQLTWSLPKSLQVSFTRQL